MATIDLDLMLNLENSSCLNEKAQVGGGDLRRLELTLGFHLWLNNHMIHHLAYTHPNTICDKVVTKLGFL